MHLGLQASRGELLPYLLATHMYQQQFGPAGRHKERAPRKSQHPGRNNRLPHGVGIPLVEGWKPQATGQLETKELKASRKEECEHFEDEAEQNAEHAGIRIRLKRRVPTEAIRQVRALGQAPSTNRLLISGCS